MRARAFLSARIITKRSNSSFDMLPLPCPWSLSMAANISAACSGVTSVHTDGLSGEVATQATKSAQVSSCSSPTLAHHFSTFLVTSSS